MSAAGASGLAPLARRAHLAILGCRGIPARYGGFETFAEELAPRLAARGFAVTVYCAAARAGPLPSEYRGVRLEHVRVPRLGPASALLYDVAALRRARAGHDVVYMLGYGAGVFLGLARRPGNEVWVNMDGLEWQRAKWGWLARAWLHRMERAALRCADRVVFDSAAVREAVLGSGVAGATVVEYGAELELEHDPAVLESLALRPQTYYVVVARVEPENHLLEMLRAFARSGSTRSLLVVGDLERSGRYGTACRAAATGAVRFLGPLFDARTLFALRHASAAVLHGHSVGGTNPSLLEAMAAGAPVIAHDNPYNREVLGGCGLAFRDEEELTSALRRAEHWSTAERARMGAENRARIAERYTWERIAEEYARLLDLAVPGAAGGASASGTGASEGPPAVLPRPARRAEPAR